MEIDMTKTYEVTISTKYPIAGQKDGREIIQACTARDAEKEVRRQLTRDCIFTWHDGPVIVKARQIDWY
jgi:hypothetical protein